MTIYVEDREFAADLAGTVCHGYFSRHGGVSRGLYKSLNCGQDVGDKTVHVKRNHEIVTENMGMAPDQLVTLEQCHKAQCVMVEQAWKSDARPIADAMVTDRPGYLLGIITADCGPVLFYGEKDNGAPVVGAAHAGWRSAFGGVIDSTVKAMLEAGALLDGLCVSIGPCIGPESYQVSTAFKAEFLAQDKENESFFEVREEDADLKFRGGCYFDLPAYIEDRAHKCGIQKVSRLNLDTYGNRVDYFSHRHATRRGGEVCGRQLSVIGIKNS